MFFITWKVPEVKKTNPALIGSIVQWLKQIRQEKGAIPKIRLPEDGSSCGKG